MMVIKLFNMLVPTICCVVVVLLLVKASVTEDHATNIAIMHKEHLVEKCQTAILNHFLHYVTLVVLNKVRCLIIS